MFQTFMEAVLFTYLQVTTSEWRTDQKLIELVFRKAKRQLATILCSMRLKNL